MHTGQPVASLVVAVALSLALGGQCVNAQSVRVEAGSGWALSTSTVTMTGTVGGDTTVAEVDPGSGPNVYLSVGLVWTLSENLSLEGRLRGQQSRLRVNASSFGNPRCNRQCEFKNGNDSSGHVRSLSVEGQLTFTSVEYVNPYFLVGLGVVRTTVHKARLQPPSGEGIRFSEVSVIDAGGDVGFGATTQLTGGLRLTAETRVTGSLPGAKEDAITTFPFTLGLSYEF